ncbi:metal-dependent hydrolase [Chloroflexota bacterium]
MSLQLRFLGHASFQVITESGTNILIDPWLTGETSLGVPPSPVSINEFDNVDLVMVSHRSVDHVGNSIEIVKRSGALLICGPDTRLLAMEEGITEDQIAVAIWGVTIQHKGIHVKIVESHHISFAITEDGKYITGIPLGFVLITETGTSIYYPGDTSLFSDLKLIGELYKPDIALLHVGGVNYRGRPMAEMSPREAAIAANWLGAKIAIPMHYLPQNTHEPQQFAEELKAQSPNITPVILKAGDFFEYSGS